MAQTTPLNNVTQNKNEVCDIFFVHFSKWNIMLYIFIQSLARLHAWCTSMPVYLVWHWNITHLQYSVQIIVYVSAAKYYRSPDKMNSLSLLIFPNTGSPIMVWSRRFAVAFPPPTEVMVSLQGNCRRRPMYQKSSPTPRDNSFPLTTTLEILVLWLRGWIL